MSQNENERNFHIFYQVRMRARRRRARKARREKQKGQKTEGQEIQTIAFSAECIKRNEQKKCIGQRLDRGEMQVKEKV